MHTVNRHARLWLCSFSKGSLLKWSKGGVALKDEFINEYRQFGLNVVYYRKKKRLSQSQLAELVDIHRTYVSSIELGKVSVSFDVLFKMCKVLEITPNKLFEFRD